jgi:MYXO-CTERM domain-containing protein
VRASFSSLVLACSLGLVASAAWAGEKNPDVQACAGKKAGDACQRTVVTKSEGGPAEETKLPGACAEDNCCELDYSKGSPPETVCAPCLACKEGPGTPTPNAGEGGGSAADGAAPGDDGARADGGAEAADNSPPATDPGKRGCSIASAPSGADATWLALAVLGLSVSRRRRSFAG